MGYYWVSACNFAFDAWMDECRIAAKKRLFYEQAKQKKRAHVRGIHFKYV